MAVGFDAESTLLEAVPPLSQVLKIERWVGPIAGRAPQRRLKKPNLRSAATFYWPSSRSKHMLACKHLATNKDGKSICGNRSENEADAFFARSDLGATMHGS
jgi:hypothetical protein